MLDNDKDQDKIDDLVDVLIEIAKVDRPHLAIILNAYAGAKKMGHETILTLAVTKCITDELMPRLHEAKASHN